MVCNVCVFFSCKCCFLICFYSVSVIESYLSRPSNALSKSVCEHVLKTLTFIDVLYIYQSSLFSLSSSVIHQHPEEEDVKPFYSFLYSLLDK